MALTKATFSMIDGAWVNVLDFIPKTEHAAIIAQTSTYDCYNDIVAAIESVTYKTLGTYKQGPTVYFPAGLYNVGTTINLKRTVQLIGENSGMSFSFAAQLKFPANTSGIIVNAYNTFGNGLESPATFGADASLIQGLKIIGGGSASTNGIWLRARAVIRNCQISSFSIGVKIVASAGGSASTEGNANLWRMEGCTVTGNASHGVYVDGADVNAGYGYSIDCSSNGGWGIWDSSFLGNTYVACHTDGNTLGAYKTDDANAKNVFLGCYSESGSQPTSSMVFPTQVIGGIHAAGIVGGFINSLEYPTVIKGAATATTGETATLAAGAVGNDSLSLTSSDEASFPFALSYRTGRWQINWANSAQQFYLYNQKATVANGYARDLSTVNGALGLPSHYAGAFTQMKYRGLSTAAPTTGDWIQGDIVFNESPTAGGTIGWVCTTAGTPGTWKTFGAISA